MIENRKNLRKRYTDPGHIPDPGAVEIHRTAALMRAKAGERFASGETMRSIAEDLGVSLPVLRGWHRRNGWQSLRAQRVKEAEELARMEHRRAMEQHAREFNSKQVRIALLAQDIVGDQLHANRDDPRLTELAMRTAKHAQSIGDAVFGGDGHAGPAGGVRISILTQHAQVVPVHEVAEE